MTTADLIKSVSIDGLCAKRDAAISALADARQSIADANELLASVHERMTTRWTQSSGGRWARNRALDDEDWGDVVNSIDAGFWSHVMERSGMILLMSTDAKARWEKSIEERSFPPFTLENVQASFSRLHGEKDAMFDEAIVGVFRKLSWHYKTNSPVRFGARIIESNVVSMGHAGFEAARRLDDLIRVMCVLDGRPVPDYAGSAYSLLNGPIDRREFGAWIDVHGLFSIKVFRNGNGHVRFTRTDLVDRMNRTIARLFPGALPPSDPEHTYRPERTDGEARNG